MARDYARSRTSRRNARIGEVTPRGGRRPSGQRRLTAYRQPRASRSFLWMISGIFMGLLIAGAFYIKACRHTDAAVIPTKTVGNVQKHPTDNTETAATLDDPETSELATASASSVAESNRKKLNATKPGKKHTESDQPHYDFYTMLPKDAVDTPQPIEKDIIKDKSQNKKTTAGRYQLQVGSFTKLQDADHLKAELILQGYTASIHKQQQGGTVRYRVNVGPFSSSKAAVARQQSLGKNKIKSIVLPL